MESIIISARIVAVCLLIGAVGILCGLGLMCGVAYWLDKWFK